MASPVANLVMQSTGIGLKYKTPVNQVDYIVGVLENLLVLKTAFKQRPVDEGMQLSKFK